MKNFLIYTLATITGIILSSIIFFVMTIASLSALVASGEKPVTINENSILVLKGGVPIPDRGDPNPWAGFDFINMSFSPTPGLNEILNNIERAEYDQNIKGILIENGILPSGWATVTEVREALNKFRKSGKFVIAWSDYVMTQEGYYLSTAADRIYMVPGSMMEFKGLSGEVMFYKKALEKIGVDVQVIRHGKFKGAVEPFMLDGLSNENREQIKDYVGSIWKNVTDSISAARGIPAAKLQSLADNLAANDVNIALSEKLIDGLIYRDMLIDTLKTLSGLTLDKKIQFISMSKYSKIPDLSKNFFAKNKIAVIYAEGTIVMGRGNETNIGGNSFADVIREQRKDTNIKAIVLRVNSPGGNALASDMMWRELSLAAAVKPVIVSMGNYAASGGYFISAPATKIFASPVTVTGSIGVFGLIPNAGKLLKEKIGITTENVNTNTYADFPSIYRPMDTYEKEVMQKNIERIYTDFVSKVSEGRKMTASSVDSIGQGRVWAGSSAKNIGLVDEIGGLKASIEEAAKLAGVSDYIIKEYPFIEDPYTKLLNQLSGEIRLRIIARELGTDIRYFNQMNELRSLSGIQARLPYFIDIR